MIKTIDITNITDEMIEVAAASAQLRAMAGATEHDALIRGSILAALIVAPAVEPAQAVEPLDAPHPDYAEYITFEGSTRIVISPDDYEQLYNAATRRASPAIDGETRKMVLELCDSLWAYQSYLPQKLLNLIETVQSQLEITNAAPKP